MNPNHSDNGTIIVQDVRIEEHDAQTRLSCHVSAGSDDIPSRLWFEMPSTWQPYMVVNGDPFYPILLLLAMQRRKRLVFELDVSPMLLSSSKGLTDVYEEWSRGTGESLAAIDLVAPAGGRDRSGRAAAAFFSCGVDSFYTVIRNGLRYPESDPRLISHLLLVQGFDISLADTVLFETVRVEAAAAAQRLGKILVSASTNARDFVRSLDWGVYGHGAAMAGVGLALGGLFHTIYIASSHGPDLVLLPWGTHPGLDPLWSNEQVEWVHDGAEVARPDKVRFLATAPAALQFLRVCWENRGGAYNCGRCEKCLRTMVELEMYGALGEAQRFPPDIDVLAVEQLVIPKDDWRWGYWVGTLSSVKKKGNVELCQAIERMLARGFPDDVRPAGMARVLGKWLSRRPSTVERLRYIDRLAFRGAGCALARWTERRRQRAWGRR